MPKYTAVEVKINGVRLPDAFSCLSLVVDNAVNLPDSFTATYFDPDGDVLGTLGKHLGDSVRIEVGIDHSNMVTLFDGEMTAVEVDYDAAHSGEGTRTIARGMDK